MKDWKPVASLQAPSAFSLEFGEQCARELALKLSRCKLNEQAKKSECRDFAKVAIEIYRKQKGN